MEGMPFRRFILLIAFFTAAWPLESQTLNLMANPGFEAKAPMPWTAADSCRIQPYEKARHEGKRSLAFYPLRDGAGIQTDVSAAVQPGYRYLFQAYFRNAEAGWGQVDVSLTYQKAETTHRIVIGRADCDKDKWASLTGTFSVPDQAEKTQIRLEIRTAWGRIPFLVDDIELRPALQIRVVQSPVPAETDIVFQLGPPDGKRSPLRISADVFDSGRQSAKSVAQPLDQPVRLDLPEGFYRVAATLEDLDGRRLDAEKIVAIGTFDPLTKSLEDRAESILAAPALSRYHGWIQYLRFLAKTYREREGAESDRALQALFRLAQWTHTVQVNSAALDTLSDVREWAYLSRVDGSGQPFKIAIPTGYDKRKAYPLVVVMHGYGGNHMEYSGGVRSNPDYFELNVLGRARGGGYRDLSEADVLDAVDYVRGEWSIDDHRIHLTGASMGGGGTFQLAVRYPDRWASGRPVCGYGTDLPIVNALHVPLYTTHSQDDPSVPVLASRAPVQKLKEAGGQAVIDETIGLQHAAWNYAAGNLRAEQWMRDQVRPDTREVRRVDYTAVDREACRAYWLGVAEWGNMPGPARFKAVAGRENQLYLNLENVRVLQIQVSQSPFDPGRELKVSVNGKPFVAVNQPLPDTLYVAEEDGAWSVKAAWTDRPAFALRTPGGVHNLYRGEPLLIVYGTGGGDSSRKAMEQAAAAASKGVNPMWVGDEGDIKDGVANHQLLYGRLRMKPDTAVTESDLGACNLLLIGNADENKVVREMGSGLPVRFEEDIVCSDGVRIPGKKAVLGLVYRNPLAPVRLIYWVAADNPSAYRAYTFLMQLQNDNPCATDMLVVQDNPPKIVKVRFFDSRWNWTDPFKNAAKISESDITFERVFIRVAEAVRAATGSDFSLQTFQAPPGLHAALLGTTQWSDAAALDMTTPLAVFRMTGADILSHQKGFDGQGSRFRFIPAPDGNVDPDKTYQVAVAATTYHIRELINLRNQVPDSYKILDMTEFDVIKRMLF